MSLYLDAGACRRPKYIPRSSLDLNSTHVLISKMLDSFSTFRGGRQPGPTTHRSRAGSAGNTQSIEKFKGVEGAVQLAAFLISIKRAEQANTRQTHARSRACERVWIDSHSKLAEHDTRQTHAGGVGLKVQSTLIASNTRSAAGSSASPYFAALGQTALRENQCKEGSSRREAPIARPGSHKATLSEGSVQLPHLGGGDGDGVKKDLARKVTRMRHTPTPSSEGDPSPSGGARRHATRQRSAVGGT